ncbi:hypothetical protein SAMN05443634_11237 [Chishuiella changwenlii]|uniref:GLPGLI family protein n=1 Tax=Chishuiella changwenlii TaxID=1434701 RepID=A0A1M7C006_9FLAO|nr:hypothetical protein [Chishuiella changwenlii]GGF06026.1 hypothetical protein GCM10010984_24120 [Chishuiella changwenlii]SHL60550.1 hypothetical protein SAMN05443634_11237 [Chishuiella changwenlii]
MKKKFTFFLSLLTLIINAQVSVIDNKFALPISFYKTTDDFINNNITANDKFALVKNKTNLTRQQFDSISKTSNILKSQKIIDKKTLQEFEEGTRSWALKYNENYFFNLGYSTDVNSWSTWVKFDVIGKYCLIFIPQNSYINNLIGNSNGGLGLNGILMKESTKWGTNFSNNNNNTRIIFIDTTNQKGPFLSRYRSSIGNLLTKKTLKKLAKENNVSFNEKEATFDDIVNFITTLNNNAKS